MKRTYKLRMQKKEKGGSGSMVIFSKFHRKSMIFHNLMMKRPKKLNFKFRPRDNKKNKSFGGKV